MLLFNLYTTSLARLIIHICAVRKLKLEACRVVGNFPEVTMLLSRQFKIQTLGFVFLKLVLLPFSAPSKDE